MMKKHSRGAALLTAMLTVTLVATFAATSLWQQYRGVEVESAERERVQAAWVLTGALDWARLILREDARTGGADNLSEPWAVPLAESRLSSFLAADRNNNADVGEGTDTSEVFLSGQIVDAQARLNVMNLVDGANLSELGVQSFGRLFEVLGLPDAELKLLANNLRVAMLVGTGGGGSLRPQRFDQLVWLGLSPTSLARLKPYATLLPFRTPVNLNTAGPEVIYAAVPSLSMAEARKLVEQRTKQPFKSLSDVGIFLPEVAGLLTESQQSVGSRMYEVYGRLRMDKTIIQEVSLVRRDNLDVITVYRERTALVDNPNALAATPTLQ
ncbi:MAG: type II secretion system minor pseudopilin GspK [Pseudomonadota bacterium]